MEWLTVGGVLSDITLFLGFGLLAVFALKPKIPVAIPVLGWMSITLTVLIRIGMITTVMSLSSVLHEAIIAINRVIVFSLTPALAVSAIALLRALITDCTLKRSHKAFAITIAGLLLLCSVHMLIQIYRHTSYPLDWKPFP